MQEKNEKISGIMANFDKDGSNIDSLIKKLMAEIAKESEEDIRKQTIQSTTHKFELTNEDDHDIDKEITELETLIKRLQAEIVEMSETANKPLPSYCPGVSVIEESSARYNGASNTLPEIKNEEEPTSDVGFPTISKDDGMLEQQVNMFAEKISNKINTSNSTNAQKDALDDVRRNFNVLWDDSTKSSESNLDLSQKQTESLSCKLSTALNFCILPSSLETNKLMFINNILIESNKSISNNGASLNDKYNVNDTRDDDKKISTDNKLPGGSPDNDDISGSGNEAVPKKIINNVPILLNAETPYNLSGNIENHPSTNITVPKDIVISLPKPEIVEAVKMKITKTLQNVTSSDKICSPEPSQVNPLATLTDTPEMMQTQSVTRENAISKTDSIFKSFNRKIRKIVGIGSEKSISKEKHKSEDLSDKDLSKEFWKAFPRSKSEPSKNLYTSDDDSSIIDLKNITLDNPKNIIKGVFDTMNMNHSKTSNSETSNFKSAENSNEIINIVKKNIPKYLSNDLIIGNTSIDKSESVTENPSDTTTTTASLSTESKNFIQAHLTTTNYKEMPINTPNGSQTVNIENINDTPTPDLSKKNPEEDINSSASITSSISSAFPKFFGSNLQTDGQQENVMKAEVKTVLEKTEVESVQGNKVEEDVEAEEDEDDDDDDDDENEDDEDGDDNIYDVD